MAFTFFNSLSNLTINYSVGIGTVRPIVPLHVTVNEAHMGNVGLGTTRPQQQLHVVGDTCFMSGNIGIGSTLPAACMDIISSTTNGVNINHQNVITNAINVATSTNQNTFCVSGIGQVGINTSTPFQLLHVEGSQLVRGRLGIGTLLTSPSASLHVVGNTLGVPGVYSSGYLMGNTFIFVLQPTNFRVHEIRFNYSSPTGNAGHSATLTCVGASETAYSTNIGYLAFGSGWTSVSNNLNANAPSIPFRLDANTNVNGVITIYNCDLASGSVNIAIDILTPVVTRVFGNMKVAMTTGNVTEFRYTFSTPTDAVGTYTITGYPV